MSPLSLRRYRAERLLREEFESLRAKVLATVRRRLGSRGVILDLADLEACYAQAWQGLYAAVLDGQKIANPTGWLVLVTFRRAIEDHRSSHLDRRAADVEPDEQAQEVDLSVQMDDRRRLRQVFEALRKQLNQRECQAASLCYLQGLSRAQAAERMGISEARMRKLMEGDGDGHPGVAGKVGALLQVIRKESWCEEQGSLMRGFAFGILDPEGERYQLALLHQRECPSCRAYVASLRGLAAVLPPLALPGSLGAGLLGGGAGVSGGAISGAGTASVGAGGGGWLLAGGSLGVKFAGCLAAVGIGAGCLALVGVANHPASGHRVERTVLIGGGERGISGVALSAASTVIERAGRKAIATARRNEFARRRARERQRATAARHRSTSVADTAEVEFSPESPPHTTSTHSTAPAPVVKAQPAPVHHTKHSSSGGSGGEFGFESPGN